MLGAFSAPSGHVVRGLFVDPLAHACTVPIMGHIGSLGRTPLMGLGHVWLLTHLGHVAWAYAPSCGGCPKVDVTLSGAFSLGATDR